MLTSGVILTIALFGLFAEQVYYTYTTCHKVFRRHIIWITSVYPVSKGFVFSVSCFAVFFGIILFFEVFIFLLFVGCVLVAFLDTWLCTRNISVRKTSSKSVFPIWIRLSSSIYYNMALVLFAVIQMMSLLSIELRQNMFST